MNLQKLFYGILVLGCAIPLSLPFFGKEVLESQIAQIEKETTTTNVVANETLAPDVTVVNVAKAAVKEETPVVPVKNEVKPVAAPVVKPEADIVYDGMTLDQLTAKLNKSLGSTISGKGSLYSSYALQKGVDPYVALAITLHETGCKWNCSKIVRECNNVGGMKGSPGCNGTSYKAFNTIDEGIMSYIDNLSENYYKKGLTTVEAINKKYAASSTWSTQINRYINEIKAK